MTYLPRANEPVTPHTHDERMVTENCPICQAQFGGGGTGTVGPAGPQGPAGTAATITVGSTTTVAPEVPASVTNTGTTSAAVLAFSVPRGVPGVAGEPGPVGQQGIQGPPGLGLVMRGEVPDFASLPTTGQQQGDLWVVASPTPAHGWAWDAKTSTWIDGGQIQGPQGIPGVAGPAGPAGPTAVSVDAGNQSRLGTDNLIFTPAPTSIAGYLPLPGGTMTGTIVTPTAVNALTFGTTTYGIIGGTGGIALRAGTSNLLVATGVNVSFPVQVQTAGGSTALQFGSGGPTMGRSGVEITASAAINCAAAPTVANHLTNKNYVDSKVVVTAVGAAAPATTLPAGTLWVEV